MKLDWYLLVGSLCMLVFLVTRWTDEPFLNGLGVGLGLAGIVVFLVSIGTTITRRIRARDHAS